MRHLLRVIAFSLIKGIRRPAVLLALGYLNLHTRAPGDPLSFVLLSGHRLLHALSASLFKISCAIQLASFRIVIGL